MSPKIEIDLNGPQGNAFCLLGMVPGLCRNYGVEVEGLDGMQDLGITTAKNSVGYIQEQMTSGDYENLLSVFDYYFGEWVILYR
jgi:hypothetical protein